MIFIRDDDIDLRCIVKHLAFVKYKIFVDIGIVTSRPFPAKWIKKHLHMYEVCNHTHSHNCRDFIKWDEKRQKKDIEEANSIIKKKIGVTPKYFIPPASRYDDKMLEVCESLGLILHPMYENSLWLLEFQYFIPPIVNYDKDMEKICKNLGKTLRPNFEKHFHFDKSNTIDKKDGWYVCHTSHNHPNMIELEKQLKYLYDNKLTRLWEEK